MPPIPGSFWAKNGQNLALSLRKWHKKNLIGENGGERKINPSANPGSIHVCTAAVKNKSVYLGFFIIYSSILIKLVSPIYSEMNHDLFYAGVVSDEQVK